MIDKRLTPGGAARVFFTNLLPFVASRKLMDDIHAHNFPNQRIEQLPEVQGDETQYAAGGGPADKLAKPVLDSELTDPHRGGNGSDARERQHIIKTKLRATRYPASTLLAVGLRTPSRIREYYLPALSPRNSSSYLQSSATSSRV